MSKKSRRSRGKGREKSTGVDALLKRAVMEEKLNSPIHQQLDITPKEGGKSLLHDSSGFPKVSKKPPRKDVPMREFSNDPVLKKAQAPIELSTGQGPSRSHLPSKSAEDAFLPPRSNFAAVGAVEQAWYPKEVTGYSDTVDNNVDVDIESMQNTDPRGQTTRKDPLKGIEPTEHPSEEVQDSEAVEIRSRMERNIKSIKAAVIAELFRASTFKEVNTIYDHIFNKKKGFLSTLLVEFKKLDVENQNMVGEMINEGITTIKSEIELKANQIREDEELFEDNDDADDDVDEEPFDHKGAYMEDAPDAQDEEPEETAPSVSFALAPGQYVVLVDNEHVAYAADEDQAIQLLSALFLDQDVAIERLQLIKRIPIDFGIVLED